MPWIPVWFDNDQWFDLIANFRPVRDLAQLEQQQRASELGLPSNYSFDDYYTPRKSPPAGARSGVEPGDRVNALFLDASTKVFQRLIGTTLQLQEEVRAGNDVQLRLPDGRVRRVLMYVPDEQRRGRFQDSGSPEREG